MTRHADSEHTRNLQAAAELDSAVDPMYDVDGKAQPGMTTANCYVVRAPGTYRLPLVYGNAVKDGVTNTDSFNPGAVANGLSAFPKHDDGAIVAPCLTDNPGVVPEDAVLLWNDGLNAVSGSGFYWTAGVSSEGGTGRCFFFNAWYVYPAHDNCWSYGFNIRPVRE